MNTQYHIEFTLEGISKTRRHIYFYTLLILLALALNSIVKCSGAPAPTEANSPCLVSKSLSATGVQP